MCLGSLSCWKMTSSAENPDSSMLGSRLSSKILTYWSAFIFPSTSASLPTPSQPIQPHTIMFPPPNFTVPCTSRSISPWPTCFQTHCFPSDPILLILVSSDQIILFQSSTVQFWYFKAKAKRFLRCTAESSGFFFFVTAFNECCLRTWHTVYEETGLRMMELMCFVAWTALATFPVVICVMIAHSEVVESLEGWPEWGDWWLGSRFWRALTTVGWLTPREEAILQVDWPLLARAMMFSFWAEEIERMGELKSIEWVGSA